jgi:hypothetical protein
MAENVVEVATQVSDAIAELAREFEAVSSQDAGDGGAYVTVHAVAIGDRWIPSEVDLEFLIPFSFPFGYVYPFYTAPVLARADGGPWPQALQRVTWREREVTQISLRPNRWQPSHETASSLVYLVQHWFRELA